MNDFINGMFRIWEKLPNHSKDAFTKQLGIKENSAIKVGSQLLRYYVELANQPSSQHPNNPNSPYAQNGEEYVEYAEYVEETEYDSRKPTRKRTQRKKPKYQYNVQNTQSTQDEDDDIIDAVWSEKTSTTENKK